MSVIVDAEAGTLEIPDIGVTLRTLLACAARGAKDRPRRRWNIVYSGVVVGSVRIKDTPMTKKKATSEPKSDII